MNNSTQFFVIITDYLLNIIRLSTELESGSSLYLMSYRFLNQFETKLRLVVDQILFNYKVQ